MAEYIKRETAIEKTEAFCDVFVTQWTDEKVIAWIRKLPAADVVEVVRCKDCKHWKPSGSEAGSCFENLEPIGGCRWVNFCRKASDFCSYGERKDGEG